MKDGQCLLEWYTTTLLSSRLISRGSIDQLWNRTWMIMNRILFTFPISRPWQCSSSQLSSLSRHIVMMISDTMLFLYDADFIWIQSIVDAERRLHSKCVDVITIVYWNSDGVLYEAKHQDLREDHIISTLSREVFYCYIVVSRPSIRMFGTHLNVASEMAVYDQ
jgi:hypothetical protein